MPTAFARLFCGLLHAVRAASSRPMSCRWIPTSGLLGLSTTGLRRMQFPQGAEFIADVSQQLGYRSRIWGQVFVIAAHLRPCFRRRFLSFMAWRSARRCAFNSGLASSDRSAFVKRLMRSASWCRRCMYSRAESSGLLGLSTTGLPRVTFVRFSRDLVDVAETHAAVAAAGVVSPVRVVGVIHGQPPPRPRHRESESTPDWTIPAGGQIECPASEVRFPALRAAAPRLQSHG